MDTTVMMSDATNDVYHAIAHPVRRELLLALQHGEKQASDLASPFDMSFAAISQHLKILREADLVRERREGRKRIYQCNPAPLHDVVQWANHFQHFWTSKLDALGEHLDRS